MAAGRGIGEPLPYSRIRDTKNAPSRLSQVISNYLTFPLDKLIFYLVWFYIRAIRTYSSWDLSCRDNVFKKFSKGYYELSMDFMSLKDRLARFQATVVNYQMFEVVYIFDLISVF